MTSLLYTPNHDTSGHPSMLGSAEMAGSDDKRERMTALEQRIENEPCFTLADFYRLVSDLAPEVEIDTYFRVMGAARQRATEAVTNPKSRIRS